MKQKQFSHAFEKFKKHAKPTARKMAKIISHTPLPEIAFVICLILSKYLKNADFQYPGENIIPILIFSLLTIGIFYAYRAIIKSWFGARLATLSSVYVLYSFNYLPNSIKNIGKILLPKHFETTFSAATLTVIVAFVFIGLIAWLIAKASKKFSIIGHLQIHKIILFALLFIFSVEMVKLTNKFVLIHRQITYHYPAPNYERDQNAKIEKPDIYYFVFDRYGSLDTLKKIYNYDNSDIFNSLKDMGFVNRLDAKANYPFTMESISSTMAMSYHSGLEKLFGNSLYQTAFPYRDILSDPPIAQVLKQNGYNYNQVSSWWDFTRVGIKADEFPSVSFRLNILGKTFYMSDLSRDIINKSILSQWLKKGITIGNHSLIKYDLDNSPRDNFFAQQKAIKDIAGNQHNQPQFTFAHFLVPHDPYVFDADGSDPSYDGGRNDNGEDELVKYTRAITYLNTQIKDMMGYIRKNSPNAAIVIQADEGPYPKQFRFPLTPTHYYDPSNLPIEQERQKYGIIASYYMPGVSEETIKKNITSSVNPFRFILKNYLGYKIDMLPDCQFSTGDKFVIYKYRNETAKLQDNPSPSCDKL